MTCVRLLLAAVMGLVSAVRAEAHIDRARQIFSYGTVKAANEYASIDGNLLTYDAAGNLCHDEDGRGYEYDEQNRLTRVFVDTNSKRVFDGGETQLAAYTYDALGRKVTATVGSVTTRFYYDGQRVIEERDAGDAVVRYHVNGAQFIDEHIATYDVAKAGGKDDGRAAGWTYYPLNANYSVAGTGDASGTTIERLDYSASGDFASGPAGTYAHDADGDADIDLLDFANLQICFGTTVPACLDVHDFDLDGQSNGVINIDDFDGFAQCFNGPDFAPQPGCEVAPVKARSTTPETGLFTLHGRPIEVLPDGKVLMDFRTRIYDPQHGRWLQRDGSGYGDGSSLYEAFRTNAARFRDPLGSQSSEDWDMTWEMLRRYFTPEGWMQRAEEKAMGLPPQVADPVAQAVFERIEVANDVAAEVARKAGPYVRPALQTAGVVGGAGQVAIGVVIIAGSEGLGSPVAYVLVARGTDVMLANAHGLYTGTVQPTAQWLLVNQVAGPEIALASGLAVDVATLPISFEALPVRGPGAAFSSTRTFAGSQSLVLAARSPVVGESAANRLIAAYQRGVALAVGEERGFVLGSGFSPGQVGAPTQSFAEALAATQAETLGAQRVFVRFVRQGEFKAIQEALARGDDSVTLGRYFTEDALPSIQGAITQLSLPNAIDDPIIGMVRIPSQNFLGQPFFGPRLVRPQFGQLGFGTEIEFIDRPRVPTRGMTLLRLED